MGIGAAGLGSTSQTSNQPANTAQSTAPGGQLGENAFLQLLVAQLKYQDPMQPVDNTQFVTQLAQFQMLSVLSDIKTDMDKLAAAGAAASGQATGTNATTASGSAGAGGATGTGTTGSGG